MQEALYFGNTINAWLTGSGAALVLFFLLKTVRRFLVHRLGKLAERTENELDDLLVEVLKKTRFFFFAIVALYFGARFVTLPAAPLRALDVLMLFGVLLQVALWGNAIISFLLARAVRRRVESDGAGATTLSALGIVARIVLWSILLLLALDNLGVNITGLVAGLGIGGIAVALALQNILGDLFASLSIALDKPFVIGDFVVVDQHLGTVEHVGLKTTRIRSLSGEQIVFANADLLNSRVRNFKRMAERRVLFTIGVVYRTPPKKLSAIPSMLKEIIDAQSGARFDRSHFKEYADSSLVFETVYHVTSPDFNTYMDIQQAVNLEIYRRFEEAGIGFAYPTRTLYLQNTTVTEGGKP